MTTSIICTLQLAALLVLANIAQITVDLLSTYKQIALFKEVLAEVLYSVVPTGSKVPLCSEYVPWPQTLSVTGKSYYYVTRIAACAASPAVINLYGAKSVGSSLGQVNIDWNRRRLSDPYGFLGPYKSLDATSDILIEQQDALYTFVLGRPTGWVQVASRHYRPIGGAPTAKYRRTVFHHLNQVFDVNLLVTDP